MADPKVNLFGPSTEDDIKVGYISTTRGYVTGVGIRDANKYAKSDPGTKFILQNRDYIKYLSINEVNKLTPEVLETTSRINPVTNQPEESCKGVEWEAPIEDPEVIFSGGGGVGVVGNPVFGTDGTLLAVDLVSGGFGYKYAPVTKLRDVSGKGAGAHLISIVGEIADTEILYDKKEDFEDYIIDDDTEEEVKEIWYGPDGKEIGTWDPSLYLGEVGQSFDTVVDDYIERLQEISTSGIGGQGIVLDAAGTSGKYSDFTTAGDSPVAFDRGLSAGVFWWTAKPPGPKLVTSNGKTTRKIYKVEHVAWNEIPPPLDSEGKVADWSTNGWLNTHAISPIPPSHAKGSARGGEMFTLEWDVDFPWDGEYSFKGSADNSAIVYVDNQELTRYELGSGGAAGKVLSLPTIVKKELTEGSHNIRIDLRNHEHIVQKQVQASSKTYGSLLQVEDIPHIAAEDQGGVTYDDLTCYAKMGRFFDINGNKAKYKVDPSLNEPEGSDLEVDFRVTSSSAFINKIEVKDLFTEQGPELIKGEPTPPEISQIEASAKFSSRGSGKDTKYYMTVEGNDLLDIQLEFRKHRDDSTRGGGHSVNAITIQTEDAPLELLTGPVSPDAAWPFDNAMITVKTGRFKNGKEYEITFSEARFQAPKPTPRIQFFGLNPANNPIEVRNNNKTLCLKDSHGSDCNAQFNIDSGDFIFSPDGRSVVGDRGMITMTLSWNDNPDVAGKAVNQIQFAGQKWFQTNCIPTTGVTPAGYANTTRGYVKFNDGFRVTGSYVTSYISTWLTQTIRTGFTYQEVFDQIVSSYATILSRKPEAEGFDYWVNSFRDNTSWTLEDLNAAISQDANNPTDGELLLHTEHNGVEGNYDECDENFFASNYGQSRTSGSQTRTFYYTTENAPPPQVSNNDQRLAFFDEDVSEGASVSDPDLIGDVRAHFNILNIEQLSESVPSLPAEMELKQIQKDFKKTVVVGKIYPVTVTNAGQGLMGIPAPIPAIKVRDIVNQDVQNTDGSETSIEKTKVFNTVDYITSANRRLWRTNINKRGGFMNDYGICPFDTYDTLPDNPYAGTHTIRWNNINFPISGNYTIRIGVDDNVDLKIGTKKGGNVLTISKQGYIFPADGGIKSTGVGTYVRYIEAGRYTIQADLTQIPGGKFGFGKIKKEGAIHDYSGHGLNPMALAITITTTVADVEEVVQRSWHANPMGVALNIKAPLPPAPVQQIPKQEGRCPSNPVWSTRFPNAKDGTWYPVRFDSWTKFHNKYGMSPVPPLPTGGTDNGGVPFSNRWDVQIPYNGWYKLKATIDDIGTISIDGDVKLELSNANKVETKEELFYLSEGLKEVEVVIQNNSTKISNWIDQKVFNTKDWVNIDPSRGGGIEKDVSFRVSTNTALQNSINIKGLLFEQGPTWGSTTSTRTDLIPGPTTSAAVEFIKRGSKYFLKASGNNKVQVKFDFRCVAPIFKGGAVIPTCVPTTGITPAGYGNTIKGYLLYEDGFTTDGDFVTSYVSTWLTDIIKGGEPICEPTTGVTPDGYANTISGYLLYNDGFKTNYNFVTSYNSTWSTDIIRAGFTYQEVFQQITESYATILSRRPEAEGFDYWVNSFRDNVDWTLSSLNAAISTDANNPTDGELLINASHNGLEGNYDECNDNFFASNYGQPTLSRSYTYQQVFEQITSSYATILSRRPEAEGFDYWVNSFKDNASWTLEDLNAAISADANNPTDGELLIHAAHNGLEGNYDECNDNFFAFDYGQQTITNIAERAAIESVTIQTMDAPLRFDNLHETTTLPDWPFKGSSVVKDAVFENGKEYEVTFSGLLSRARSTPPIKYIGLKTPGDKKYINSKKLVFDDNSPNGFDVNATFTIDSGDVTFSSDGNSLVGSKSGNVTMTYSWNDHPNIAGVVLDEIKIGKTTWKQSGTNGKVTRTFNYIANPNPTPPPEISSGGATDNSNTNQPNQRICFYDLDTSGGATAGPDLIGDVRAHFTAINVIQMDDPDPIEEVVEFDDKQLVQINNTIIKDVVIGQVYEVEIENAGTGLFPGNYVAPPNELKASGGVLMVEDIPHIAAEDQGGITHDDLVCAASKGRFFDINGNKCKYMIDPPTSGGALRNGVTYNGPKLWNYKHNSYGAWLNSDGVSPDYPANDIGQTINYVWSNVDFPETGEYTFKFANDAHGSLYLDGETVLDGDFDTIAGISARDRSNWDPGLTRKMNVTKGKHTIAVAPKGRLGLTDVNADGLFRKLSDDYMRGQQAWENNASAMAVSITRRVDAFAGTPEASKSWMENPISISAELIPPPCPRRVRGGGVVTEVEIIDPGNEYSPPPPTGDGYPAILTLNEIVVDDPGINYDCSKDKVVIEPANGAEASLECDNFGRIKKVNLDDPGSGFTTWPDITIDSPTGVAAALRPKFKVTRELPPAVMIDEGLDPDKLIQVTDLVGLKQTGYYDGKPYYGAVFYKDGVRYAGYYETTGVLVQIYDTMQESIDGMVTTPASAILRQGTDIASDDPNLDIPNTPDTLT